MVRNMMAAVLGLVALAAGPMASTARAETPRQAWLADHPIADARYQAWRENHPFRSGWDFVGPAAPVAVDPVRVGPVVVDPVVDPVVRAYRFGWRWYR